MKLKRLFGKFFKEKTYEEMKTDRASVGWVKDFDKAHPQAYLETESQRENPGFKVPKEIFKWNNWSYVDKIDRIHQWNVGQKAAPYKMIIIPANRCNLKCPYCPNSHARTVGRFKASDELTDEQWYTVVREALDMGVEEYYVLGGGEPLLRKDMLMQIYQMIKAEDPEHITELITNGFFFKRKDIDLIVEKKLINKILFSIDGHTADVHDLVRGVPGSWKRVTDSVALFNRLKKEHDHDKPILHMNHIISNRSYKHLVETVELCHTLGVVELALHPMREYEETQGAIDHLVLTKGEEHEMFRQLEKAQKLADRYGIYLNVSMVEETIAKDETSKEDFLVGKELLELGEEDKKEGLGEGKPLQHFKTFCYEPLYSLLVDPKGNANYCCTAGDSEDTQNVAKHGLKNIWFGQYLTGVRGLMLHGKKTPKCFNCGLYDMTHDLKYDMKKYVDSLMKGGHFPEPRSLVPPPEEEVYFYSDNRVEVEDK